MQTLSRPFSTLFTRTNDRRFDELDSLLRFCYQKQEDSKVHWRLPSELLPTNNHGKLQLKIAGDALCDLNDWSFGQICRFSRQKKDSVNRMKAETATQVLMESFPYGQRPLQVLVQDNLVRSINSVGYVPIYDSDLLDILIDETFDLDCPPIGESGSTGFYAGEQDMFAGMIDDKSWVEIGCEAFAPGLAIWNSEVGSRSLGIESFWLQRGCSNHIVWDATDIVSYRRRHHTNVDSVLKDIRFILKRLVLTSHTRKDRFAKAIRAAMATSVGNTKAEAIQNLGRFDLKPSFLTQALDRMIEDSAGYTVFNAVDYLTRGSGELCNAGARTDIDIRIGKILSLAV
ncbi:MAG: DUF932 domain-containing protein [Pirellulaceae bacterium]|nr:DUF932 domain-containing protein [Pirellulaceae bacterium]